ncbi:MAG: D-alanine--D-alanine ligase [Phycisphaerae bacterium]|nr:D-alanine--D-alanine ligase [Phycisphaerae bacterium]
MTNNKLNIMVLLGGPGAEREVSLTSGAAVAKALTQAGHNVQTSDIGPDDLSALDTPDIDLFFPVLHGTFGEDGQLQKIMEDRKLKFTYSDSVASQLAMDKYRSKLVFTEVGLYTAPSRLVQNPDMAEKIIDEIGTPCVIKPNCQGSSVGIAIAKDRDTAVAATLEVLAKYGDCLVEKFISGPEFTVGILLDKPLPVLEVRVKTGFYDYEAKYQSETTEYILDPEISLRQSQAIQAAGLHAFGALGCRDLARVDFILADAKPYILEVNTIPGFTDHSLVPKSAAHIGMTMAEICDKIAQNAFARPI